MGVTITAGAFALIVMRWGRLPRARCRLLALAVAALAIAEATALVYMGVHYVTDVLGGLAVSLAWLGVIRLLLPPQGVETVAYRRSVRGERVLTYERAS